MKKVERTEEKKSIPRNRESLIEYIIKSITNEDAICIAFCHEIGVSNDKDLDYLCTNQCKIHREWTGHLLCLSFKEKAILKVIE